MPARRKTEYRRPTRNVTGIYSASSIARMRVMTSTTSGPALEKTTGFFMPTPRLRPLQFIGWDGILPLFVALGPVLAKAIFLKPPMEVVICLIFAPLVAALIRAHIAGQQFAQRFSGHAPWLRHIALASAILLLLVFEAAVAVLTFAESVPASDWWFPAGIYGGYLAMISFALRSRCIQLPTD